MKKFVTWVCIISLLLLLLFYAISASAAEKSDSAAPEYAAQQEAHTTIERARELITNDENGLEALVRSGTTLLLKGPAWEPLARKKLYSAALLAVEIENMLAPYLPPQGVSALRYIQFGVGDRVVQKVEWSPYTKDLSGRLASQKSGTKGEIVAGPQPYEGSLLWEVRFGETVTGWLPENVLTKEFQYPTVITATACWMHGNVLTYKMLASLRSYQQDEIVGERYAVVKDIFASIIAAYECALATFAHPDSIEAVGATNAARYREIIKKNFPIMQEQQKQAQKKSSEGRVESPDEGAMVKALLGDQIEREKKGQQRILVPPPEREGDPRRRFSPGIPVGVH